MTRHLQQQNLNPAVHGHHLPRPSLGISPPLLPVGGAPFPTNLHTHPTPVPGATYCSRSGSAAGCEPGTRCWPGQPGPQDSWESGGRGTGHLAGDHSPVSHRQRGRQLGAGPTRPPAQLLSAPASHCVTGLCHLPPRGLRLPRLPNHLCVPANSLPQPELENSGHGTQGWTRPRMATVLRDKPLDAPGTEWASALGP